MPVFDEDIKKQLQEIFGQLRDKVNIIYFTHKLECGTCKDTHDFLKEITVLSDKLNLTVFDFEKDRDKADNYKVDKIPAILILDKNSNDTGIKFYGLPSGHEINSFVKDLIEVSGKKEELDADIAGKISAIKNDVHIQVFVSTTCPYCSDAVSIAHRLALENSKIRADMVDSATFQHLAIRHNVNSVPKIIINDKVEFVGVKSVSGFIKYIEKALP